MAKTRVMNNRSKEKKMKGIDYDAWLEKPYQDMVKRAEEYDAACDRYEESSKFDSDYKEWVISQEYESDDQVFTVDDYRDSSAYEEAVAEFMDSESQDDYYDEPDYDYYDSKAEAAYERSIDRARGYDV